MGRHRKVNTQKLYSPTDSESITESAENEESENDETVQSEPIVTLKATLKYNVPKDAPHTDAGKETVHSFEYQRVKDDETALGVIAEKKWTLKDIVNKILKANARSSKYQVVAAIYDPEKMLSTDEVFERMVKDFQRSGFSEAIARIAAKAAMDEAAKQTAESNQTEQ